MPIDLPSRQVLPGIAAEIRKEILHLSYQSRSSHIGSAFSIVEILAALYFRCMNCSPEQCTSEDRDRFILSKGHACAALYVTLAQRGYFGREVLYRFGIDGGTLEHHPARDVARGIEVSTGSLGHGLAVGSGLAVAAKRAGAARKVFVLLSDGEMNEGSTWEAVLFAAHHRLSNLVAIVDYNRMQALGESREILGLDPLADKWKAFGWSVREIDGHDIPQILDTFNGVPFDPSHPSVIIAHTVKGKGVSFMENNLLWHYRIPDEEEYRKAVEELESK